MTQLLFIVGAFLLITMLLQRPMKKQAQQQAAMRDSVTEGTRVVLTSGIFGTITHVGTEQVIVELAPGVEVTALKSAIARVVEASDEEFEFADDADGDVPVEPVVVPAVDEGPEAARPVAARPEDTDPTIGSSGASAVPAPADGGPYTASTTQTPSTDRPAV